MLPTAVTDRGPRLLNLVQCRNRFVDPYCSGWFRAELAERNAVVVREHLASGGRATLLVHTCHHQVGHRLGDVMDTHASAWHLSRRGRRAKRWSGTRWWRAWDIVLGGRRGPHPHSNTLVLGPPGHRLGADWLGEVSRDWTAALLSVMTRKGVVTAEQFRTVHRNTLERGLLAVRIDPDNVDVLTAYAARHVEGATVEVVDNANRQTRSDLGGYTLMALACMAHQGQDDAGRLLGSAAVDLAGRRSYSASRSWPSAALVDEDADADAAHVLAAGFVVGMLQAGAYRAHRQAVDAVLDAAAGASAERSVSVWRHLDSSLSLGIAWLAEPVALEDWQGDAGRS